MTPPRYIVPEQMSFVTCSAVGRSFRFVPSRGVVELIMYVLAVVTQRTGVQLHEVLFMSNHFHILLTDRYGVLPDFMRDLNSLLSRGLNALRGSVGSNVESGYNVVVPRDDAKVVEHAVYALTNPCNAGLVERAAHWQGVSSLGMEYGQAVTVRRPTEGLWKSVGDAGTRAGASEGRVRHSGRTSLPESAELVLVRPAVMAELSDAALREHIRAEVRRVEADRIAARRAAGEKVLGMKRVAAPSYTDTPSTSRALFATKPRVSGTRRWARLEALARRLEFERAHARARDAIAEVLARARQLGRDLRERLAAIVLPYGSFLLRRRYGGVCELEPAT